MGITLVFCSRCGTKNNDDARYCTNCNESLRSQTRNFDKELADLSWELRRKLSVVKLDDYGWLNRIMSKELRDDYARVERYEYLIERLEYSVNNPTIPTGIQELDDILYGGIPSGYSILLTSPPSDEKDLSTDELGGTEECTFGSDMSPANGSSIALMAEYEGCSALLAGDAHPEVLKNSIEKLLAKNKKSRLSVDIFKIPHHGSMSNITLNLLEKLSCGHYLISTSGAKFRHPNAETIDLLLSQHNRRGKPRLHFNYCTCTTDPWSDESKQKSDGFYASYPMGVSLTL